MNKEQVIDWARESGFHAWYTQPEEHPDHVAIIEHFAALVAAAEREACAKVCEQEWNKYCVEPSGYALAVNECAAAIRARGNT